jgi:ABC-type multidrug transport system fused ATPase/permease subunit
MSNGHKSSALEGIEDVTSEELALASQSTLTAHGATAVRGGVFQSAPRYALPSSDELSDSAYGMPVRHGLFTRRLGIRYIAQSLVNSLPLLLVDVLVLASTIAACRLLFHYVGWKVGIDVSAYLIAITTGFVLLNVEMGLYPGVRLSPVEELRRLAVSVSCMFVVLAVGGLHVLRGDLTIGGLLVVIAYLAAVYGPLSSIAHTTGALQNAIASSRRVREIFALVPETLDQPDAIDASDISGAIRFEHVSFAYDEHRLILDDVSFTARPGEMVALVGLTGAGKSTLVSLVPRFYEPTRGRVLIDGIDVAKYRLRSLRQRIALVPQDGMLFGGTIADNLRYGRLDATAAELEDAARAAHAHDFIMRLPHGYDTPIAEAGGSLSGGERQRLSIARALLKNVPILILDEPTSSLDAISEASVFDALRRLRAGRTTLVIAHRLSTIRDADRILVLHEGRIAAHGTHAELLASNQLYRRMCARLSVGHSLDDPETVDDVLRQAI